MQHKIYKKVPLIELYTTIQISNTSYLFIHFFFFELLTFYYNKNYAAIYIRPHLINCSKSKVIECLEQNIRKKNRLKKTIRVQSN